MEYNPPTIQIARWLYRHGPATKPQIRDAIGMSIHTLRHALDRDPDLFPIVGYQKPKCGPHLPLYKAEYVPVIGRLAKGKQYPIAERARRWLLAEGKPATLYMIADGLGLHWRNVRSAIETDPANLLQKVPPTGIGRGNPDFYFAAKTVPGDEVTIIHTTPTGADIAIRGITDGHVVRANGVTFEVKP